MNYLKSIIGGMEQPSENYSIAEQAKPIAESRYQQNNLASTNNSSNNKNKKTRKVATIVRPRRIMIQKTPKSMKKRVTNLENTVNSYGSKINNFINKSQTQKVEKEEIVYVPIVFKGWNNEGEARPIAFIRNTATEINLREKNYNYDQGSNVSVYYDFDIISQLKYVKRITIIGSNHGANFIINGKVNFAFNSPLNELKTELENNYPHFKNIEIKIFT